ncbi:MAG: protein kinase [Myxococcales bacterium]|nr:protein kinase [Myxococcales bacterium]
MPGKRFVVVGSTPFTWEREAIEFLFAQMPDQDPFHARALLDLHDPGTGSLYELDVIAIGWSAIYLVEIKSHPGKIEGDELDWRWTPPEGRVHYLEHPLRALNLKAKVLRTRLEAAMRKKNTLRPGERLPWIQPLVFLSADGLDLRLTPDGQACVVKRGELSDALRQHKFPSSSPSHRHERITSARTHAIQAGLDAIGLRARQGKLHVGAHELGATLGEGRGYQDREATHRNMPAMRRRARTYLVPDQTDRDARLQLRREADRDASLLWSVREHPGVLTLHDYVGDAPVGPTLVLDRFEGGVSLPDFLRKRPALAFADRVAILEQVALALAHCHRRVVYHGGLAPDAVLVRQLDPQAPPEVRVFNFQAGRGADVSPTVHRSRFASEPAAAYQAPELFSAADALGPDTDLFSLGALGYYLFTGQAPAQSGIELQQRLDRDGALDPRSVTDTIPDLVADAIVRATRLSRGTRGDAEHGADVGAWIEAIKAGLRPHGDPSAVVSPLEAHPGDRLREDLEVVSVLGRGASACVLEVKRDGQSYALKVSLGPAQDERLQLEARTLHTLRHPRIVQLHETFALGDRQCLLLSLAGTRTLQQAIDQQGSVDLDLALRYGDDLLSALEHLEDEHIGHRDLKPANLGEGSLGKQSKRLMLFDFSLAGADPGQIDVGTEPYRDPFLPLRGRWDPGADRWSAAVVLHEMLTGVRPTWKPRGISPLAPDAVLQLAGERFDAAARDRLTAFFKQALARDLSARFPTATAMRTAWAAVAEAPRPSNRAEAPRLTDDELRAILSGLADDAPLDVLPLSVRARNALDRAGLTRATALLSLPDNRLSSIRGAGSKVRQEIDELRRLWLGLRAAPASRAFFPHFRGRDVPLDLADLPTVITQALADAGLVRLAAVAAAPEDELRTLARRHGFDLAAVHTALQARHDGADARDNPTTSQAWVDSLFTGHGREDSLYLHVRRWLGLESPQSGRLATVRDIAAAGDVTTAAVYQALGRARERTQAHPALPELCALVTGAVDDLGGVAPFLRAAEAVRARLGEPADDPAALARAAALVRWVAELQDRGECDLRIARLHEDLADAAVWVSRDPRLTELVRRLGEAADELAAREVLAAPGEAESILRDMLVGTALATLPQGRLLDLAAQASRNAACSSRLELYRRDLPADRAILHAAPILTGELRLEEVEQRVRARYPDGEPMPPRPDLDALLAPLGLQWAGDRYRRRGDEARSSLHTRASAPSRRPTAQQGEPPARTPEASRSRAFETRLAAAVRDREPLLLAVSPFFADLAAAELSRVLQRPAVALDRLLLAALDDVARAYEIDPSVLRETDLAGPSGPEWPNLCRVAAEAAERVAAELFPARAPLLLTRPGLVARWQLTGLLQRMIQSTREPGAAALFFLIPCNRAYFIEDALPVPGLPASQRLQVPDPWLLNEGRRAASEHP